jgi:hypothetical protein
MADDKAKKTKIDLKARLGRTTAMGMTSPAAIPGPPSSSPGSGPVPPPSGPGSGPGSAPGSVAPPPSRPSNVPNDASVRPPPAFTPGIAPPPGLSTGIPLPAFGPQPRAAPRAEPKPSAAQQTIKVEIGEEIHEERKKARNRAMLAALGGAVIGLGIGFTAGGSSATGDRAKAAARGAEALEKDVKAANEKLVALDAKLGEAADKLNKSKIFPDDLSTALAGLTIPFDSTNLDNKGVNGMPGKLFKMVLNYTQSCENLNKLREQLKNASFSAKDPMTKAFKEETAPVANYSVTFRSEGGKVVADLVQNKDNFAWKGDFPAKYKIAAKPADKDVVRWVKGDLTGGSDTIAVPIDPKTTAAFASDPAVGRFYKALLDMRTVLQGNKDNPTTETAGLLKDGEELVNELHKQAAQFK